VILGFFSPAAQRASLSHHARSTCPCIARRLSSFCLCFTLQFVGQAPYTLHATSSPFAHACCCLSTCSARWSYAPLCLRSSRWSRNFVSSRATPAAGRMYVCVCFYCRTCNSAACEEAVFRRKASYHQGEGGDEARRRESCVCVCA